MLYLLISAIIVNGVHAYLLISQRDDRKLSISSHAAHSRTTYLLYLFAHLVGGLFFLLFAHDLFARVFNARWIFILAIVTVVFQYLQALIPYTGKTTVHHEVAACGMWVFYLLVGYSALITLPLQPGVRLLALPFLVCPIVLGTYAWFHRQRMYWLQMIVISSFCIAMFVIAAGK